MCEEVLMHTVLMHFANLMLTLLYFHVCTYLCTIEFSELNLIN